MDSKRKDIGTLFINQRGELAAMPDSDNPIIDFKAIVWLSTIEYISASGSLFWNKQN